MKELDYSVLEKNCSTCANKNCTFCEDYSNWTRPYVENKSISQKKVAVSIAKMYQGCR